LKENKSRFFYFLPSKITLNPIIFLFEAKYFCVFVKTSEKYFNKAWDFFHFGCHVLKKQARLK